MANQPIKTNESALQNVLDLVDSQNPAAPNREAQVTTSNLQAVSDPTNHPGMDTSVEIDAVAGQGYTGAVTVYYDRVALSDQVAAESGAAALTSTMTAVEMLAAVATHFNLILAEISWVTTPTNGDATGTVQASGSLIYHDGQTSVALSWS
jgi:hypothetical protein